MTSKKCCMISTGLATHLTISFDIRQPKTSAVSESHSISFHSSISALGRPCAFLSLTTSGICCRRSGWCRRSLDDHRTHFLCKRFFHLLEMSVRIRKDQPLVMCMRFLHIMLILFYQTHDLFIAKISHDGTHILQVKFLRRCDLSLVMIFPVWA